MQSKNKRTATVVEQAHIGRIKLMPCCVCGVGGGHAAPSEAHEIEQGLWFTSLPLCADCHRGSLNGIHGQRRIWAVHKYTELERLNAVVMALVRQPGRTTESNFGSDWVDDGV